MQIVTWRKFANSQLAAMTRNQLHLGDSVTYFGLGGQKVLGTVVHIPAQRLHKSCVIRKQSGRMRTVEIERLKIL